jgi:DNA mismatch repair protein MutL
MPRIKLLPTVVINKIAAGEVIERPASVVKELIENSIDAQATEIVVEVEEGGAKLIRVADNGYGMDREDVALAFHSHSTSKLAQPEDLMYITTLGFRGEALPSIGAVSHASIVSRARGAETGHEIEISGGKLGEVREKGCAPGTSVTARNLFFNTPVRMKFMRSESAEMTHVTDVVTRVAMAHCNIKFELIHNGKRVFLLLDSDRLADRIRTFFGDDLADVLIPLESHTQKLNISGYVAPPSLTRRDTRMQYIYLNSRPIRDRVALAALKAAYADYLMGGRSPVAFVFLDMDPREFDVNVHPTKAEVRFRDSSLVMNQLRASVQDVLAGVGHAPLADAGQMPGPAAPAGGDWKGRATQSMRDFFARQGKTESQTPRFPSFGAPQRFTAPAAGAPSADIQATPGVRSFFQVHNAYIVVETDEGIEVIDQHALHERLIYERLCESVPQNRARQKLLVPETAELSVAEWQNVGRIKEVLTEMGFEISDFGGRTLLVSAAPQAVGGCAAGALIKDMIDEVQTGGVPETLDALRDAVRKSIACKAAIKAGEPLSQARMADLLSEMGRLVRDYSCPHGRPLALRLTLDELARRFKRT